LDNARIHHTKEVEDTFATLESAFGHKFLYLPPYSPFLNPIEYAFNVIKSHVARESFSNRDELIVAIDRQVAALTSPQAMGFFRQSRRYLPQAAAAVPFTGKPLYPDEEVSSDVPSSPSMEESSTVLPVLYLPSSSLSQQEND